MAVSAKWYTSGPKKLVEGTVDWDGANAIKVALATSAYSVNQDTHEFASSFTANEVANGNGYTTGGKALAQTSRTVAIDAASNETRLDGEDAIWTSASFTARYAIVYYDTGTPATAPLLGYVDFGADETVSAGTFTITWDTTGILKITAA